MNTLTDSDTMSGVDLAWLRMETPKNPMTIVGVLTLATPIRLKDMRLLLTTRLGALQRLRQRPVDGLLGARWEPDPQFDIAAHVRRMALPGRRAQPQLEAAVSELASTPLDPGKPRWQMHLVERYRKGSALIVRIHHCYADGMALVRVLLSLTDAAPVKFENHPARVPAATESMRAVQHDGSWLGNLLTSPVGAAATAAQSFLDLAADLLHSAAHPEQATELAKQGIAAGAELARIGLLSNDPPTPLKGPLGIRKNVAWSAPLPLFEIKTISKALDCTINDALLATVAGALGAWLRTRDFDTEGIAVRALLPVNLRDQASPVELGNYFGLVFADLPLGVRNPLARLYTVHEKMAALKNSPQASVSYWLLAAMGSVPQLVEDRALDFFTAKATAVVSNVIGPAAPLYLAGAKIDQQFFWVPQAGSIGLGMSMLTYNDCVHFGVMADAGLFEDASQIVRLFAAEYEKLVLLAIGGFTQIP